MARLTRIVLQCMVKEIKVHCLIKIIIINSKQAIKLESLIQSLAIGVDEIDQEVRAKQIKVL